MTAFDADDHHHMVRALELARRGLYSTPPNPSVGCVLARWGQVVAGRAQWEETFERLVALQPSAATDREQDEEKEEELPAPPQLSRHPAAEWQQRFTDWMQRCRRDQPASAPIIASIV